MEYNGLKKEVFLYLQKRYDEEEVDNELLALCCEMYEKGRNNEFFVEKEKKRVVAHTWRNDKEIYLTTLFEAFEAIKADKSWVARQSSYYKGVDVIKTIERAIYDYWATDNGWKNKKSKKGRRIDWVSTFANSLSSKYNQVPLLANDMDYDESLVEDFIQSYKEICNMLPQPIEVSGYHKQQIMLCVSELGSMDKAKEMLQKVADSDFLTGRVKGRTIDWIATMDWIIKDKFIYNKIMEGKYDNIKKDNNNFTIAREHKEDKKRGNKKDF